jgi:hypothetical protein
MMKKQISILLIAMSLILVSCDNDDDKIQKQTATFKVTVKNVFTPKTYQYSGSIGAIPPGESQEFTFNAGKGSYLSFANMFVKSNDLFYGFSDAGLALYDANGNAISGDVSMNIQLWDAGTEVNEEPGMGANQPMNQSGPNTGDAENGIVHMVNDGFTYPSTDDVIEIKITHDGGTMFTVKIENNSATASIATPLAPGVWAVHSNQVKLFESGVVAPEILERLAEDGDNSGFNTFLMQNSGYVSPFAPGVYAIHKSEDKPIFTNNVQDDGAGLEALAEDGDPSNLVASLAGMANLVESGVFNTPEGASAPGALMPNNSYSFTFTASEGDNLSLATMLVHSNDLFFAFADQGISLFSNGVAVTGDVTSQISLWDAGTEVNEFPGAGNNQPARGGANSGLDENGLVVKVNDGFTYPSVSDAIEVKIELQ